MKSKNAQWKIEHIFGFLYADYGINIKDRKIIIWFLRCRHAQSCAFISVIELPRIPAYCPKIRHYVAERSTFDDDTSYIIPGNHADIIFRIFRLFIIFHFFFRLPIDIFIFVRYYNINKRKGGRTTNQLNLYLKSKERGTVQCRGQSKLKRV